MNFRELSGLATRVQSDIYLFGASKEALQTRNIFYGLLLQRCPEEERRKPGFAERTVPDEIVEAFRPLYSMYQTAYKNMTGEELLSI